MTRLSPAERWVAPVLRLCEPGCADPGCAGVRPSPCAGRLVGVHPEVESLFLKLSLVRARVSDRFSPPFARTGSCWWLGNGGLQSSVRPEEAGEAGWGAWPRSSLSHLQIISSRLFFNRRGHEGNEYACVTIAEVVVRHSSPSDIRFIACHGGREEGGRGHTALPPPRAPRTGRGWAVATLGVRSTLCPPLDLSLCKTLEAPGPGPSTSSWDGDVS